MMAAIASAGNGSKTLLIEKNEKLGKSFLSRERADAM